MGIQQVEESRDLVSANGPEKSSLSLAAKRYLSDGSEALSDFEHLALLLQAMGLRGDPEVAAGRILLASGSFGDALQIKPETAAEAHISEKLAAALRLIGDASN